MRTLPLGESAKYAGKGTTGAEKAKLYVPAIDREIVVKWKEMPRPDLDGNNNSPRRELAAYAIQRLVLISVYKPCRIPAMRC